MNFSLGHGNIYVDEGGQVWYLPEDTNIPAQMLADSDSLCGAGIFETGPDDPLRVACSWHDNAYSKRAFFEERGWNRDSLDKYFLQLLLVTANGDDDLIARARRYYAIVRMVGWIWYYRHPAYVKLELDPAVDRSAHQELAFIVQGMEAENPLGFATGAAVFAANGSAAVEEVGDSEGDDTPSSKDPENSTC